ncbi:MAG: hypothetical protein AAFQ37_14885, partial [Bacteroidota bacterium]
ALTSSYQSVNRILLLDEGKATGCFSIAEATKIGYISSTSFADRQLTCLGELKSKKIEGRGLKVLVTN